VGGFIERLANLDPGLRHDPMRVTLGFDSDAVGVAPGCHGGPVSFSDRALSFTLSLGPGPADFTCGLNDGRWILGGPVGRRDPGHEHDQQDDEEEPFHGSICSRFHPLPSPKPDD